MSQYLTKICTYCFKKENHRKPLWISIWKLHVLCKKVSVIRKKNIYIIENGSGSRPPKTHFWNRLWVLYCIEFSNFRLWVLYFIAIGKIVCIFFQKAETFLHRFTSWNFFFEIHISNKKWLEISVFDSTQ